MQEIWENLNFGSSMIFFPSTSNSSSNRQLADLTTTSVSTSSALSSLGSSNNITNNHNNNNNTTRNTNTTTTTTTTSDTNNNNNNIFSVPDGHGLLVQLNNDNNEDIVTITSVPDKYYPNIHMNCYAPAELQNVKLLHGGGSGTAVFGGHGNDLINQDIVMKHGSSKDTKEVFSLVTITTELLKRQNNNSNSSTAATNMKRRIPEFIMVYISPYHFRDRGQELWTILRTITYTPSGRRLSICDNCDGFGSVKGYKTERYNYNGNVRGSLQQQFRGSINMDRNDNNNNNNTNIINAVLHRKPSSSHNDLAKLAKEVEKEEKTNKHKSKRNININSSNNNNSSTNVEKVTMRVNPGVVDIDLPTKIYDNHKNDININNTTSNNNAITIPSGNKFLQDFCVTLREQQEKHNWKVTLGQKSIGGINATNGAYILTSGKLDGTLLNILITDFTSVINDLDSLTKDDEKKGHIDTIIKEIDLLRESYDVKDVSKELDAFVGKCIIKNFHPEYGRLTRNLRLLGEDFLYGEFFLTDEERIPANFLGLLLEDGANMNNIFYNNCCPMQQSALDVMIQRGWIDILDHAISYAKLSPNVNLNVVAAATDRIWTCGLTDCGLHNTFLCVERGLEIFDLGEPTLEPRPAFLTKFLMSFFHTSGMEEDDTIINNANGDPTWKTRFDIIKLDNGEERLILTPETENKLPYLHDVFTKVLNHIIDKIFYGEESIKELLIKYVVLQLLSDSSFCLQKWETRGGGNQRYGKRLQYPMEKWLWRSLWDQYIACSVYAKYIGGDCNNNNNNNEFMKNHNNNTDNEPLYNFY